MDILCESNNEIIYKKIGVLQLNKKMDGFLDSASIGGLYESPDIESSSEDYASRFAGRTGKWFLKIQGNATLRMLKPWPAAKILDLGGGHGQLAPFLTSDDYKLTVHGSSPVCIDRVNSLVADGKCSYVTSSLFALPFPDRSFDVVTAFRLMAHLANWRRLVEEMTRVARYAVLIDFPPSRSLNCLSPLLFNVKLKVEGNTRNFLILKKSDVISAFEDHHFGPAEKYAQYFLPMFVHRVLKMDFLSAALEKPFRWMGLTSLVGSPLIMKFVRREEDGGQKA